MFGWKKNAASPKLACGQEISRSRNVPQKRSTSTASANRKLAVDALESRALMAGDVTAAVIGNELHIHGDDQANAFAIVRTPNAGAFQIVRTDANTTINGSLNPYLAMGVTGGFVIESGAGNDRVGIHGASIGGALNIDTGVDVGADIVNLVGVFVAGNLTVNTGAGVDVVSLVSVRVTGSSTLNTGAGNDVLSVSLSRFFGSYALDMGTGNDAFASSSSGFRGTVGVDMGTGNDSVVLASSVFRDSVSIALGDGDDRMALLFSRFDSVLTADGGIGSDALVRRFNQFLGDAPTFTAFERFPW
jgi:hypothetical protein